MEADHAILDDELKTIAKKYRSKDGGRPAYKTYLDAKAIKPGITLELVKSWLKKNVEPTRQVGGARNSYVAPHAGFEYQADLFFMTDKQFPNQDYKAGLSMIDVFSKFAVVTPLKEKKGGQERF